MSSRQPNTGGAGDRAIAAGLNRDAIPCPSASRPEQNRHRWADGWQGSTVRAILENPRYTGYAVFGRWTKHEELADPDDVAAGNVTRFRRSSPDRVVRSRRPAHPGDRVGRGVHVLMLCMFIVGVSTFAVAQLPGVCAALRALTGLLDEAGGDRGEVAGWRSQLAGLEQHALRGAERDAAMS